MSNLREKILSLEPNSNTSNQTALVDGIYITSQAVRRQALSFIWAKYNMLPDNLTQSLGRLYDAVEEIYLPDKNEKSLFNYTHDKSSVYSRSIAEKNLTVKDGNVQRSVTETPRDAYNSWYKTAYQGKNYYNVLKDYNESFGENTKITYDDDHTLNSIDNGGYVAIDYENEIAIEYAPLTAATQTSYDELNSYKKPRRKDFRENGSINEDKYSEALKKWDDKKTVKGKNFRKDKKSAKDQYIDNLDEQNSFIREPKTLLTKTSKLFKENKIESLVTRTFGINTNASFIDTSVNKISGRSRGRNLRKKNEDTLFPFCRAWVAHHQYGKQKNSLIRPFDKDIEQSKLVEYFRSENGGEYLHDYSVLKNGFVKITPERLASHEYDTKRCMFSIENLAWKDVDVALELERDQIGPNGGRIMWFPPYDLSFQESSQAQWNEINFIGRGEPIYTYTNTKRTGSLSFTLLIDHPSIINIFDERKEKDNENQDDDILRFFAGCDIPMEIENKITNTPKSETQEPEDIAENISEEGEKLKFSVYFPNNYSGHYSDTKSIDDDWAEYLFWGFNLSSSHETEQRGYEMKKDLGISDEFIEPSTFCITKDGTELMYFYRHDVDMCDKIKNRNLVDSNSKQLNSLINTNDNNTISFAELFIKLNINDEKIKEYGKNLGLLNEEYEFINQNVKKLDSLGNCKFKVIGFATTQKSSTSKELAERRAETVKSFLKTKLSVNNDVFFTEIESVNVTDTDINTKNSKKGRRVDVEISYNLPTITTQNDTDTEEVINVEQLIEDVPIVARAIKYAESDYFKNLEHLDNFAYQTIKEKIKYFEPAYHSISPEGFNSRLTFLHQCTRQGHTIERKENDITNIYSTAGNMAFGRPPFCVLRIGDFINTKILIRSLNIVYQNGTGMQWDMNPEGIGVQPMFAKVTMQIEIIGGQSLDAPVSRLNNAVSFNYYANTGVYNNRADRAIYNGTGITYSDLYEPIRINHTSSSGETQNV